MDANKVGRAIAYLRKRAGYTQKDLADRIGISDKAVSKWERGVSLPDIAYLGKLAILLDTDSDSLLSGDVVHHDRGWKGLLVLDDNSCGIGAGTMVYDKPLVYILLSYFLLVGINRILISCPEKDRAFLRSELGGGEGLGVRLTYCASPEAALEGGMAPAEGGNVMVVYGRSLLYGVDQTRFFHRAMANRSHVTVLSIPRKTERRDERLCFDESRKIVSSEEENRLKTQYEYAALPIFFAPAERLADACRDAGIIARDAPRRECALHTEVLDRGFVALSLDSWDDVAEAAGFLKIVQKACGMNVYCLEEIAWRRGMIDSAALRSFGEEKADTPYGRYILSLCE